MVIGLLGAIGAGKSTVAKLLADEGAEVVDADRLAHEVLCSGEGRGAIVGRFGAAILGQDGEVDRRLLAQRVFGDAAALQDLNAIVHPPVLRAIQERIERHRKREKALDTAGDQAVLALDVPLLAETPLESECDALLFVDASPEVRAARLRERGWSSDEAARREAFQPLLPKKRASADVIVDNSGPLAATRIHVRDALRQLGLRAGRTRSQESPKQKPAPRPTSDDSEPTRPESERPGRSNQDRKVQ